jgi:hypothetical protein
VHSTGEFVIWQGCARPARQQGQQEVVGKIHRGERGIPAVPTQRICQGTWAKGRSTKKLGPSLTDRPLMRTMLPISGA